MLSVASVFVIAIWGVSYTEAQNKKISKIHYDIESIEGARNLITKKELKSKLDEVYGIDVLSMSIAQIDFIEIEDMLLLDDRIYASKVYVDALQEMHISIVQRRPIVRIMDTSGAQYYLDQEGKYISKQDYKAIRVPIATGAIEAFSPDWSKKQNSRIRECFQIVNALRKDKFLTALVEQIHFENERILLIPKMGNEKIVIKYLDDLDRKLNNLKKFYKTVMAKNDSWGKYKEIDISYKNQVVPRRINP